jgi:GntR family transcriptional regulator, transcriptional repressor for pyruvate dehydrogenase complex
MTSSHPAHLGGDPASRIQRHDLVDQVVDAIVDIIRERSMRTGDRLPSETELQRELGVGRSTVREAIRILGYLNVVEAKQGYGTFVGSKPDGPSPDFAERLAQAQVLDVHEVRLVVETGAAALAAERRDPSHLKEMRVALDACFDAAAEGDLDRFVEADLHFHMAVAQATRNPVMEDLYGRLRESTKGATSELVTLGGLHAVTKIHDQIYQAIERGDGTAARRATRRHLEDTVQRLSAALTTSRSSTKRRSGHATNDGRDPES